MKRFAAVSLIVLGFAATPCQAQILQKIEQGLLGGQQQQGMMPGQTQAAIGSVNLPAGQYLMTNVQNGQAFYVMVQQNGQMFYTPPPSAMAPGQGMVAPGQGMMPGQGMYPQQQPGMGGYIKQGLGNFLKNELTPQQQQQVPLPNQ